MSWRVKELHLTLLCIVISRAGTFQYRKLKGVMSHRLTDYGARSKKKIVTGKLTEKSYIPSGLTKAQYEKIRAEADKKKAANYQKNVAKAGVFDNYTEFYLKRGSDKGGNWLNDALTLFS